jgi:hypothetical protein
MASKMPGGEIEKAGPEVSDAPCEIRNNGDGKVQEKVQEQDCRFGRRLHAPATPSHPPRYCLSLPFEAMPVVISLLSALCSLLSACTGHHLAEVSARPLEQESQCGSHS